MMRLAAVHRSSLHFKYPIKEPASNCVVIGAKTGFPCAPPARLAAHSILPTKPSAEMAKIIQPLLLFGFHFAVDCLPFTFEVNVLVSEPVKGAAGCMSLCTDHRSPQADTRNGSSASCTSLKPSHLSRAAHPRCC